MAELAVGDLAPDFTTVNQDGKTVKLSDLRGKPVLLFFYPKDNTPGCTKEACSLRNEYSDYRKQNVTILGISRQDEKSHREFRDQHSLPFDLLVDKSGDIAKSFGVGKIPLIGFLKRQSILIGADGKISRIYRDVSPGNHALEVLKDLGAAAGAATPA